MGEWLGQYKDVVRSHISNVSFCNIFMAIYGCRLWSKIGPYWFIKTAIIFFLSESESPKSQCSNKTPLWCSNWLSESYNKIADHQTATIFFSYPDQAIDLIV